MGPERERRRVGRRGVLLLSAGVALSGCGFKPMYASRADGGPGPAREGLARISIGLIPERSGQLLRQALQERFEHGEGLAKRYDLSVSYGVVGEPLNIQQTDSAPTRLRLTGLATWTLTAQDPQRRTLATGTARVVDGMNLFDQQFFATDMEAEAVQRRLAEAVAEQITLQLAAYFNKRAAGG